MDPKGLSQGGFRTGELPLIAKKTGLVVKQRPASPGTYNVIIL